jgi:hypothetical protein
MGLALAHQIRWVYFVGTGNELCIETLDACIANSSIDLTRADPEVRSGIVAYLIRPNVPKSLND